MTATADVDPYDRAEFATNRGGAVGHHRIIIWEAKNPDTKTGAVGGAIGTLSTSSPTWTDDLPALATDASDLAFPSLSVSGDQVFIVTLSGTAKAGSLQLRACTVRTIPAMSRATHACPPVRGLHACLWPEA